MNKTNPASIFEILRQLPPPFGPTCPSLYQNLSECWGDKKISRIIDWAMHPHLDPLALLDNSALSGSKKHKVDVYEQTVLISN